MNNFFQTIYYLKPRQNNSSEKYFNAATINKYKKAFTTF